MRTIRTFPLCVSEFEVLLLFLIECSCVGPVSSDRPVQRFLFLLLSPLLSLSTVWSNTHRPINPDLSIPTAITARPKRPDSLIRGEFTSRCCQTAGSAMGPYLLFITANWRRADSGKSFRAMIDQQRAICLSFLSSDINVALCLFKATADRERWSRTGPGVRPEVRGERGGAARLH